MPLPERVGKQLYLHLRADALVEDIIYSVEDGHVDVIMTVFLLHTLCAEESLRYHLHLYLRTLDAISLAYHRSECAVARELGISRHEQVAEVNRVVDAALNGIDGREEARHLLYGVRDKHRLEVVTIVESAANAGRYGIDILEHRRILDADDVA